MLIALLRALGAPACYVAFYIFMYKVIGDGVVIFGPGYHHGHSAPLEGSSCFANFHQVSFSAFMVMTIVWQCGLIVRL